MRRLLFLVLLACACKPKPRPRDEVLRLLPLLPGAGLFHDQRCDDQLPAAKLVASTRILKRLAACAGQPYPHPSELDTVTCLKDYPSSPELTQGLERCEVDPLPPAAESSLLVVREVSTILAEPGRPGRCRGELFVIDRVKAKLACATRYDTTGDGDAAVRAALDGIGIARTEAGR